jgi:hypothetical protein
MIGQLLANHSFDREIGILLEQGDNRPRRVDRRRPVVAAVEGSNLVVVLDGAIRRLPEIQPCRWPRLEVVEACQRERREKHRRLQIERLDRCRRQRLHEGVEVLELGRRRCGLLRIGLRLVLGARDDHRHGRSQHGRRVREEPTPNTHPHHRISPGPATEPWSGVHAHITCSMKTECRKEVFRRLL